MDEKAFEELVNRFCEDSKRIMQVSEETNKVAGDMNKLMDEGLRRMSYLEGQNEQLEKRIADVKDSIRWTLFAIGTIIIGLLTKIAFF